VHRLPLPVKFGNWTHQSKKGAAWVQRDISRPINPLEGLDMTTIIDKRLSTRFTESVTLIEELEYRVLELEEREQQYVKENTALKAENSMLRDQVTTFKIEVDGLQTFKHKLEAVFKMGAEVYVNLYHELYPTSPANFAPPNLKLREFGRQMDGSVHDSTEDPLKFQHLDDEISEIVNASNKGGCGND
jgi:regulator of replication initiation timing